MNYPAGIMRAKAMADMRGRGSFVAKATPAQVYELYLYDAIGSGMFGGGISAKMVADALAGAKGAKELRVFINSPGGDVFDGVSIFNQISRFPGRKKVTIDGIAASAASMIAMAGDEIEMAIGSMMMIHQAWGMCVGNSDDMRKTAEELEKVTDTAVLGLYARTKLPAEKIAAMMRAETWLTPQEAVELGFADRAIEAESAPVASMATALRTYANAPAALLVDRPARRAAAVLSASMADDLRNLRRACPASEAGSASPHEARPATNYASK